MWLVRLYQQLQYLHEQSLCMRQLLPPDAVVYAGGGDVASLLNDPNYLPVPVGPFGRTYALKEIVHVPPPTVITGINAVACVMQHARKSPGHPDRLIYVAGHDLEVFAPASEQGCQLSAMVVIPANLELGYRATAPSQNVAGSLRLLVTRSFKIFAGQPDPVDESHFTINCELDGQTAIIDGWLMPDDTVKLERRRSE